MNFDLDDDQRSVLATARRWYASVTGPAAVRAALAAGTATPAGTAPAVAPGLAAIAQMGFLGITVPESAGGAGQPLLDLAVVAEQGGRVLAGPSLVSAARAAILLEGLDDRLAALADGSVAYAVVDGAHPAIDAVPVAAAGGTFLALDGAALVAGRGEVTGGTPLDPSRGLGVVRLTGTEVLVADAADRWERARRAGCVILAAEDLGTADRALETAVEYAKLRHAFGRPIGSYQAVKHALVDAFVLVEQLRSLVWWAAWAADDAPDEAMAASSAAKAFASDALEQVTETVIQVHGGIGFTWEHDAHLYWRRGKVDRLLLGDATSHREVIARRSLAAAAGPAAADDASPPRLSSVEPTAPEPSLSGVRS